MPERRTDTSKPAVLPVATAEPAATTHVTEQARLRSRSLGIAKALHPLFEAHRSALTHATAAGVPLASMQAMALDFANHVIRIVAHRYDSLDQAVHVSSIPFAEIDSAGLICYANSAFAEHVPNAVGRQFATLFVRRNEYVADALRSNGNTSLRIELDCAERRCQFRAEIGPLTDEHGGPGNYALLLDVSAEEQRMEAAPNAIVRIDPDGLISFVNAAAEELIGSRRAALLDKRVAVLFGEAIADHVDRWLSNAAGFTEELTLITTQIPVRVSVMPFFDEPGRQAGVLLSFASIAEELVQKRLQQLLATPSDPLELIGNVIRTVRTVVPFDLATFGIYTRDRKHFRMLVAEPQPDWRWGTRWFDLTPETDTWLAGGKTWAADVGEFAEKYMPEAREDPVVRCILEQGLHGFVTLPIQGANGVLRSALTLMSKTVGAYEESHLRRLRSLGLERVLQASLGAFDRQRDLKLREMKSELAAARNARQVADRLAEKVAGCFSWEYVGVFRVDRANKEFVLFAQHDATKDHSLTVRAEYRQKLSEGMLHHAFEQQAVQIVPDTTIEPPPLDFIRTTPAQASAMVVPIRVGGRIELMLDIESVDKNAFQGDDKRAVEELVVDCEQIFESRWQHAIRAALMEATEEAAVVIDAVGAIRTMNGVAGELLGPAAGKMLSEFGAGNEDQAALRSAQLCSRVSLTLRNDRGLPVPTLATQWPLNDDYGHRMWVLTSLHEQRRQEDWVYLDRTVSEVARQTRAPLLIADSLLRRAAGLLGSRKVLRNCAALLHSATHQLSKADLTFERLSGTLQAYQHPTEEMRAFDALGILRLAIGQLPDEDAEGVAVEEATCQSFVVDGWPDRLEFALRSLLAYLLLGRVQDPSVTISWAVGQDHALTIHFKLAVPQSETIAVPAHAVANPTDRARQIATLAPEAVRAAIGLHGGSLETPAAGAHDNEFRIVLPPGSSQGGLT